MLLIGAYWPASWSISVCWCCGEFELSIQARRVFGKHYHWQLRSWFTRIGVDPMLATVIALLGGVALGYGVAVLLMRR